jgi:trigger factor
VRVEVEHLPQSQVQLQIEIDAEMLGHAVDKAYQRLAGRYRVPGFRPGKAPRAVLERTLGPELLLSEAADICMNDAYAQAIKEHDLQPIGYPDVDSPKAEDIKPDQPLRFTAKVYVRPKVALGDYHALRIAPTVPDVTPEAVDRVLQRYREEQAPWERMEEGAAEAGDLVSLRLLATVGDETLVDQESWEYRINPDEQPNLPIPGLSQQILGMQSGESKDVTLDLGEDYVPAEYAGQQMSLHLELLRLDRRHLPEFDEAFARGLGSFESMDQLREALQTSMQQQARQEAMDSYVDDVVRQVVDQSSVEVPPPLVDQEVDDMMHRLQESVEHERKISMDTYTRIVGKSVEELREEARPMAEQRVRTDLVLDAVADAEEVTAPEEEVEEQVRVVAASPTLSNKERRRLLASDDLRQRIRRRLRRQYAINRLLQITRPPEEERTTESAAAEEEAAPAAEAQATLAEQASDAMLPVAEATETAAPEVAVETTAPGAVVEGGPHESPPVQQNEQES